jgi:hypothetical protein
VFIGWGGLLVEGAVQFGVDGVGFGELVFEDDDAARCVECGAVIDEFAGPGSDAQLVAGVAAVSALGPLGGEEFRFVEAAQESWGGSQDLSGATHAVGGVVLVIDLVVRVTVGRTVIRLCHNTFQNALLA